MIKNTNKRIIITISKRQAKFLEDGAKKLNISVSQFVRWLIDKNITRIINVWTDEELKEIQKIAKVKWIGEDFWK